MFKSLPNFINKSLVCIVALLVFLTPLFFLPETSEFYEFNKQALLGALLVIGYLLLVVRMVLDKGVKVIRTKLDLPIFLLLAVYVFSTVFSISPINSFLGYHGRFHGGLLSLILYVGLFYLVVNVLAKIEVGGLESSKLVSAVLASSFILSLLAILSYFEIYLLPFSFAQFRAWTPIGSPKTLVFFLAISFPLTLFRILQSKKRGGLILSLGAISQLFTLGLYNLRSAWIVLGVGVLSLLFFCPRFEIKSEDEEKTNGGGKKRLFFLLVVGVILSLSLLVSSTRRFWLSEKFFRPPSEITLDLKTSWLVTARILVDRPFLGSGPSTSLFNFTRFRPSEFNFSSFWNFRFDRAGNELFEILSTLGLVGLTAWIWFLYKVIVLIKKGRPVTASLFAFLATLLFYPTTTAISVFFWMALAIFVSESKLTSPVSSTALFRPLAVSFLVLCLVFSYFYFGRIFLAEVKYGSALAAFRATQGNEAYNDIQEAIKLNPYRDVYHTSFSTINLAIASAVSRKPSPDADLMRQLILQAINSGRQATQLCPVNVNNWEHLAGVYLNLTNYATDAPQFVINSLEQAISLDPLSPRLRESLGRFFLSQNQLDQAINNLAIAINLQPNYAQAHYDLAQAFKARKDYQSARVALNRVFEMIPEDNQNRARIEKELKEVEKLIAEQTPTEEPEKEASLVDLEVIESPPSGAVTPTSGFGEVLEPIATPSGELREIPVEPINGEIPGDKIPSPNVSPRL